MADVLISDYGSVRNISVNELLLNEQHCIRYILISILEDALKDPNSELLSLLEQAMNTIADKEIVKVLE